MDPMAIRTSVDSNLMDKIIDPGLLLGPQDGQGDTSPTDISYSVMNWRTPWINIPMHKVIKFPTL